MKITIYILLALTAVISTASCGTKSLKVSEIADACAKLPDSRENKGELEKIIFDGYLTKDFKIANTVSGLYPFDVQIKDTDNDKTVTVRFEESEEFEKGGGNNKLNYGGDDLLRVKSNSGEIIKIGEKMRILAQWANTKGDRRYASPCTIIPLRIDKQ